MAPDRLPLLDDDGLLLPEVGGWAETKYRLISSYSEMFATAMRDKWDSRVYVDLFAGAGRARIRGTGRIVPTSAMLALQVRHPFDRYVFCDSDSGKLAALEARARRDTPGREVRCIPGDSNINVNRILGAVPKPTRGYTVLSFCVVDPFNLASLKLATVEALAARYSDFLLLIPSYMDAHRNLDTYLAPENRTVEESLGDAAWRDNWVVFARGAGSREFGAFVVDRFGRAMRRLGYLYDGPGDEVPVHDGHLLLYHLCFFSRHERGRDFWRKARRSSLDQMNLFE